MNALLTRFSPKLAVALACGGGAVLALVLAVALPLDTPAGPEAGASRPAPSAAAKSGPASSSDLTVRLAGIDLRRPLIDAPATAPARTTEAEAEVSQPASASRYQLLGTIVEPGHSLALFEGDSHKTEWKFVGDDVAGAKLLAITPEEVTLRANGEDVTVALQPRKARPASTALASATPSDDLNVKPDEADLEPDEAGGAPSTRPAPDLARATPAAPKTVEAREKDDEDADATLNTKVLENLLPHQRASRTGR